MAQPLRNQQGMVMMSVITTILILALLSVLVLSLSGKELALSAVRLRGAQSLFVTEGGAVAARSALMAFMNADPIGVATLDASLSGSAMAGWYAGGDPNAQNSFAIFDFVVLDDKRFTLNATAATNSVTFHLNWSLPDPHRKLQVANGFPPANPLGSGTYSATVVITRRAVAHPSCTAGPCYVHRLGPDEYEYLYTYSITSDGGIPPQGRRRVTFSRDYSMRVRRQNFAKYALFTHIHMTPNNLPIWFTSRTSFDGPVHTNGQFRFAFFPKYGTPDPDSPCDPARIKATPLTSVSTTAWFNHNGNPVQLNSNENVVNAVRRDAPVTPDCTPANLADDSDNPPATFSRGVELIPIPANAFSQKGVSIGRNPANISPVTNLQIRQVVPELPDTIDLVPFGIYVPVTDSNANGISDAGEALAGGIYVQGTLDGLTLALGGGSNNLAVYTLVQGTQTVTITVNRLANTTTVTNTAWSVQPTRTFIGVPKGWQGPGNASAVIAYVEGDILSVSGTLEEKEQMTIAASGRINITNHVRYEDPPIVTDPNDNPINVLGLYSSNNDIRITTAAPDDLQIHAVMMAGNSSDAFNSSVNVQNYNTGDPRGMVHLIGGLIEEYYGAFGTFNPLNGATMTGYGRDFKYDRRMSRGFSPPYFPTTSLFEMVQGADPLAGVRPNWREASP